MLAKAPAGPVDDGLEHRSRPEGAEEGPGCPVLRRVWVINSHALVWWHSSFPQCGGLNPAVFVVGSPLTQAQLDSLMAIAGQNAPHRMLKKSYAHVLSQGVFKVEPWQIRHTCNCRGGILTLE
jgi:hypothetical protein